MTKVGFFLEPVWHALSIGYASQQLGTEAVLVRTAPGCHIASYHDGLTRMFYGENGLCYCNSNRCYALLFTSLLKSLTHAYALDSAQ